MLGIFQDLRIGSDESFLIQGIGKENSFHFFELMNVRLAYSKQTNRKCQQDVEEKRTLIHCWHNQFPWKTAWIYLLKNEIRIQSRSFTFRYLGQEYRNTVCTNVNLKFYLLQLRSGNNPSAKNRSADNEVVTVNGRNKIQGEF